MRTTCMYVCVPSFPQIIIILHLRAQIRWNDITLKFGASHRYHWGWPYSWEFWDMLFRIIRGRRIGKGCSREKGESEKVPLNRRCSCFAEGCKAKLLCQQRCHFLCRPCLCLQQACQQFNPGKTKKKKKRRQKLTLEKAWLYFYFCSIPQDIRY